MIGLPEAVAIGAQPNKTIRGKRIVGSVHYLCPFSRSKYVKRSLTTTFLGR